jgi:hypothetical protein
LINRLHAASHPTAGRPGPQSLQLFRSCPIGPIPGNPTGTDGNFPFRDGKVYAYVTDIAARREAGPGRSGIFFIFPVIFPVIGREQGNIRKFDSASPPAL